tara:strand:- start:1580 stop:1753 length:174 start_codon:yes stop_codon:yes gene_type:complete
MIELRWKKVADNKENSVQLGSNFYVLEFTSLEAKFKSNQAESVTLFRSDWQEVQIEE